jgi:hypothetical protein
VLRNPQKIEMTWLSRSTPCVKTGFVPKLLSRLGRDKSEGQYVSRKYRGKLSFSACLAENPGFRRPRTRDATRETRVA